MFQVKETCKSAIEMLGIVLEKNNYLACGRDEYKLSKLSMENGS